MSKMRKGGKAQIRDQRQKPPQNGNKVVDRGAKVIPPKKGTYKYPKNSGGG